MLKRNLLIICILLLTLPSGLTAWADTVHSEAEIPDGSRFIGGDEQSVTVEYVAGEVSVRTVQLATEMFQQIELAETVQHLRAGDFQVPVSQVTLGIPDDAQPNLTVLEVDTETLPGHFRLRTTPELEPSQALPDNLFGANLPDLTLRPNVGRAAQETDQMRAHRPAELGAQSRLRDQSVVSVRFYPVAYQPESGKVTLYHRIRVQLSWTAPEVQAAAATQRVSPHYESVFEQTLLNYEQLARPRVLPASTRTPLSSGGEFRAANVRGSSIATDTLKIWTDKEGFHRLTHRQLADVGFDLSTDPQHLRLTNKGQEVAIWIIGEKDGTFDADDAIVFYAEVHDTEYSGENVYWLKHGAVPGLRMASVDGSLHDAPAAPGYFRKSVHAEVNSSYWQTMPDGEGEDHWFWGERLTAPVTTTRVVTLTAPVTGSEAGGLMADVKVQLKGRSNTAVSPDHHSRLLWNDVLLDDWLWDGFERITQTVALSQTLLTDGPNTITLFSVGDTGSAVDQIFLNWIEVDYWQRYRARENRAAFAVAAGGPWETTVEGFTAGNLNLFDITHPKRPKHINNFSVDTSQPEVTLRFTHSSTIESDYFALSDGQYANPLRVELDEASALRSPDNGADYILVTPPEFLNATSPLAAFRQEQGLRVITAQTDDIYDEFSGGIFTPQAIRDFLAYAFEHWRQPAPAYVLLVGDATLDYRDRLGTGSINFVPSQLIETHILGQTPSDNWFVQISGEDALPDMFIGRLSAQTAAQATDIVQKLISYETSPPDASWNANVLFVADDDSLAFSNTSDVLSSLLPATFTVNRVDVGKYAPDGDPPLDINNQINLGALFTNYTGHGAVNRWGKWGDDQTIYGNDDVDGLTNGDKLTIVTTANCLNGFFTGFQNGEALAEKFQRLPGGGAVAVWAPSNLFYPSAHRALLNEFYAEFFRERTVTLGAATTRAKIATVAQSDGWDELVEAFILFGDPATSLDEVLPALPTPTPAETATPEPTVTPEPTSLANPVPTVPPHPDVTDPSGGDSDALKIFLPLTAGGE